MKSRFDNVDVMAMVSFLTKTLIGRRVINIYEGDTQNDAFIFKLDHQGSAGGGGELISSSSSLEVTGKEKNCDASKGGDNTNKNNNEKPLLYMQSGIRFHVTQIALNNKHDNHKQLSPFVMKLRKNIRGLRLEFVKQVNTDRVVQFIFGSGNLRRIIILELYSKGNIILCDEKYLILALLRSHQYENNQVQVQVGHVYPVTYATTTAADAIASADNASSSTNAESDESDKQKNSMPSSLSSMSMEDIIRWTKVQLQEDKQKKAASVANGAMTKAQKKKKKSGWNDNNTSMKTLLLKSSSGFSHYGPSFLEHCILVADQKPDEPLTENNIPSEKHWEQLILTLKQQSAVMFQEGDYSINQQGYIFCKDKIGESSNQKDTNSGNNKDKQLSEQNEEELVKGNIDNNTTNFESLLLEDFQPFLFKQNEGRKHIKYDNFSQAVDMFFTNIELQKRRLRAEGLENAAKQKLNKVKEDQFRRVQLLQEEQNNVYKQAQILEYYADDVEKVLIVVNSALDNGMDWDQLEQLIHVEQTENNNPIAKLICKLELEKDTIILALPDIVTSPQQQKVGDDEEEEKLNKTERESNSKIIKSMIQIPVSLKESAHGNASMLFTKYSNFKDKSKKTIESTKKALKAAEEVARKQLLDAQKRMKQTTTANFIKRKTHWFEKFNWFITSDNYLVLGGRDAHQNELLVKRYLRKGDAYLHADVHGAASCILRAKRRRIRSNKNNNSATTQILPLSEQALREAGNFTICRSSAWTSKIITSAWYVESHQVSKTAPTGEYLKVGGFMIRGRKTFLPPSSLEMGIAVLFRLGDNESINRHKNDRRDFVLMQLEQDEEEIEGETMEQPPVVVETSSNQQQQQHLVEEKSPKNPSESDNKEIELEPRATVPICMTINQIKENSGEVGKCSNDNSDESVGIPSSKYNDNQICSKGNSISNTDNNIPIQNDDEKKKETGDNPAGFSICTELDTKEQDRNADNKNESEKKEDTDNENENELESTLSDDKSQNKSYDGKTDSIVQPEELQQNQPPKKKKGFSVRERKLIRKYGSLEKAEVALAQHNSSKSEKEKQVENEGNNATVTSTENINTQQQTSYKRGKKAKMKRAMKKYGDQDEEDRELAMLALHGGEKHKKKSRGSKKKGSSGNESKETIEMQEKAAADTAKLLVKDSSKIAKEKLNEVVKSILAECVTVEQLQQNKIGDNKNNELLSSIVRWDKFDADVLENLINLNGGQDAQIAASKRLLYLKKKTRIDNFSASLAGIIRTIERYGYKHLEVEPTEDQSTKTTNEAGRRKTKEEKQVETTKWKKTLAEEGIDKSDNDDDDEDVDDTVENNKLTGKPNADDKIVYAIPVCAPYSTLSQYTYRIKLTPGNMKRGKAAKQCLEMFTRGNTFGDKTNKDFNENCKTLIKNLGDNDWIQTICPDVKLAAAGASKAAKRNKNNNKKSKKR